MAYLVISLSSKHLHKHSTARAKISVAFSEVCDLGDQSDSLQNSLGLVEFLPVQHLSKSIPRMLLHFSLRVHMQEQLTYEN